MSGKAGESVEEQFPDASNKAAMERRLKKIYGGDDDKDKSNAGAVKRGKIMSKSFMETP